MALQHVLKSLNFEMYSLASFLQLERICCWLWNSECQQVLSWTRNWACRTGLQPNRWDENHSTRSKTSLGQCWLESNAGSILLDRAGQLMVFACWPEAKPDMHREKSYPPPFRSSYLLHSFTMSRFPWSRTKATPPNLLRSRGLIEHSAKESDY